MGKTNLRDKITVFVISVDDGSESYQDCIAHLNKQDSTFVLKTIKNVVPMNKAFQQMLDLCETPYFIQVDHDMNLNHDSVRKLLDHLTTLKENTAIAAVPLLDHHLWLPIIGLKIYRTDIVKQFPFHGSQACEMDQVERLKAAGYEVNILWRGFEGSFPFCYGSHGKNYTNLLAFEAYRNRIVKTRKHTWINWVRELPAFFLRRYNDDKTIPAQRREHIGVENELDLWAFLGCMAGAFADLTKEESEKDYRTYSKLGFEALLPLVEGNSDLIKGLLPGDEERVRQTAAAIWTSLNSNDRVIDPDEVEIGVRLTMKGTI